MTEGEYNKKSALKKLRGCIAASPMVPFGFVLTSSSWLSSLLPFYSPPNFLKFTPALLAERVFNLMYSDRGLSCQEESDVSEKKNEISMLEAGKLEWMEARAESIPPTPLATEKPLSRQACHPGLASAADSSEDSRCGRGGGSHPRTKFGSKEAKRQA